MVRWTSIAVGCVVGLLLGPSGLGMAGVLLVVGGLLNAAFRASPGEVALEWRAVRQRWDPDLYSAYSHLGPYLWRFGVAMSVGSSVATLG